MMKFAVLMVVLLAVAGVQSTKPEPYYGYGYGLGYGVVGGGCIDTLSGCGGFVSLGYCGQAYYASGCCASCGFYKKK